MLRIRYFPNLILNFIFHKRRISTFNIQYVTTVDPLQQGLSVPLIGRSNVGKSSLYNTLLRTSTTKYTSTDFSIVSEVKNTTRDFNHSIVDFYGKKCILFDTGGLGLEDSTGLMSGIWENVKKLFIKSHIVLFVLDGDEGITPLDYEISQFISKWSRENELSNVVIPVINKIKNTNTDWDSISESYELGFGEPIKVCSITLKGIDELKHTIHNHLKNINDDLFTSMDILYNKGIDFNTYLIERKKRIKYTYEKTSFNLQDSTLRVTKPIEIIPKVTEPWFRSMNRIFGENWNSEVNLPSPNTLNESNSIENNTNISEHNDIEEEYIKYTKHKHIPPVIRVAFVGSRGTGKSSLINAISNSDVRMTGEKFTTTDSGLVLLHVVIKFQTKDSTELDEFVELIDTAPFNLSSQLGRESSSKTIKIIQNSHICVLCLNKNLPTRREMKLARNVMKLGKSLIISVTHSDEFSNINERTKLRNDISLKLKYVPVLFTSNNGLNCQRLLKKTIEVFLDSSKRISNTLLNDWLRAFVARWPPPWLHGSKCNIKYIAQTRTLPPTFVLWSNVFGSVPHGYLQQMKKSLKEQFNMSSCTIKFVLRTTVMPKPGRKLSRHDVLKWKRLGPIQESVVTNLTRRYRVKKLPINYRV